MPRSAQAHLLTRSGMDRGIRCVPGGAGPASGHAGLVGSGRAVLTLLRVIGALGVAPNGARLLSERSVRTMARTNHLGARGEHSFRAEQLAGAPPASRWNAFNGSDAAGRPVGLESGDGSGAFALGGYLTTERSAAAYGSALAVRPGQYGWVGMRGVVSVVDPVERLELLVLTQHFAACFMPELRVPIMLGAPGRVMRAVYRAVTPTGGST